MADITGISTIMDPQPDRVRDDYRLATTELAYDNDAKKLYYSNWALSSLTMTNTLTHIVKSGEENRIDLIALKYYNNVRYWWVIALANNIYNAFLLTPGTSLKIPKMSEVYAIMRSKLK